MPWWTSATADNAEVPNILVLMFCVCGGRAAGGVLSVDCPGIGVALKLAARQLASDDMFEKRR
jgi:hypothetical protein